MKNQKFSRDSSIDILRGIAIITMLFANLMGSTMAEPHSLAMRAMGSFAAPLFILLAGMMVGRGIEFGNHSSWYFTKRGILLILIAAIVCDMLIWGVLPLLNMEVLYLIGISLPVAALLYKAPFAVQLLVATSILLATPYLQTTFGYKPDVFGYFIPKTQQSLEYVLNDLPLFLQSGYLKQIFIDGWFPIFPWIGFALLGTAMAKIRWINKENNRLSIHEFFTNQILYLAIFLISIGIFIWTNHPGALHTRLGFSELFYPATPGYIITAIGIIAGLFWIADKTSNMSIWNPVKVMGQSALFLYVFHWIMIDHIIDGFAQKISAQEFYFWYALLFAVCLTASYLLRALRKHWTTMPATIKFVLG